MGTAKLAQMVELLAGNPFKSEGFTDDPEDVCLIKGENIGQGAILWDISKRWPAADWPKLGKFQLLPGDVVVAMDRPWVPAGLKWASIRAGDPPALLVQRVARLRSVSPLLRQGFIRCLIGSPAFEDYVRPITSGVNVPHLSGSQILDFEFRLPSVTEQDQIVALISAYDDLIENSLRRMRILEEMSRGLYREWFVECRAPGSAPSRFVALDVGLVPEGWQVLPVRDSFEIRGGGTPSRAKPEYWVNGHVPWFAPRDLTASGAMFMEESTEKINDAGLASSSANLFPAYSVMLTSRATIGAIAVNTVPATTNQGFITCLPNERVPLWFLYWWVRENVPTFERLASGATFKEISRGVFKTIPFVHPPAELVQQFQELVTPWGEGILNLQRHVRNLQATRDLLLPRLISGQLSIANVEGLAITPTTAEGMAAV